MSVDISDLSPVLKPDIQSNVSEYGMEWNFRIFF